MKSNASLLYSLSLVVGDFLALVAAFVGAYILRVSISSRAISEAVPAMTYLEIFLILLPFWILIFALLGLYNSSMYEKRFVEVGRLAVGSFIGFLFVIGYAYFEDEPVLPARLVPIYGLILAFIFLVIFRNMARYIRRVLFSYDIGITNLLIVGENKITQELVESLADRHISGYKIVGIVGPKEEASKHYPDAKIYESFEEATSRLRPDDLHGIVQTELYPSVARNNEILEFAQTHHISYRFIPGNTELFVGNIQVELFQSSIPVIAVHQTALIGWGRVVKRLSDVTFGGAALLVALPFMLVAAFLVKLTDPRAPILYKVGRLSRFGYTITIYKFRTMKPAYNNMTPEEGFQKMGRPELTTQYRENGDWISNDPRISAVGRFLRRFSLDELPQLWNVVKGDISFVGPRALEAIELNQYSKKNLILSVKSGLTGLAQVSGRREISTEERRKLDLYYVQNWSFWMDLVILIKTIRVVLRRSGV